MCEKWMKILLLSYSSTVIPWYHPSSVYFTFVKEFNFFAIGEREGNLNYQLFTSYGYFVKNISANPTVFNTSIK